MVQSRPTEQVKPHQCDLFILDFYARWRIGRATRPAHVQLLLCDGELWCTGRNQRGHLINLALEVSSSGFNGVDEPSPHDLCHTPTAKSVFFHSITFWFNNFPASSHTVDELNKKSWRPILAMWRVPSWRVGEVRVFRRGISGPLPKKGTRLARRLGWLFCLTVLLVLTWGCW